MRRGGRTRRRTRKKTRTRTNTRSSSRRMSRSTNCSRILSGAGNVKMGGSSNPAIQLISSWRLPVASANLWFAVRD